MQNRSVLPAGSDLLEETAMLQQQATVDQDTGVFIFPPHLFNATTLPWEIVKTLISAKIKQNHKNFTGRCDSD